MNNVTKKSGLLYTDDLHTVIGVDFSSLEFDGKVPFGAKKIDDKAFSGVICESITIPDSVKIVGFNLFENAKRLKSVKLPSALSELTPYMFSGCSSLETINMPSIVSEFPERIFYDCVSLHEVPFRTDITYIGVSAFEKCTGITSLVFPITVQTIDERAFADCTSIRSIVIGENVSSIADDAFRGCTAVKHIRLDDANNFFYIDEDGSLCRKGDGKIIIEIHSNEKQSVSFFGASDSLDDGIENSEEIFGAMNNSNITAENPVWIDEVDDDEEDDTFSAEVGADSEEEQAIATGENVPSAVDSGEIAVFDSPVEGDSGRNSENANESEENLTKNVENSSIEGDNRIEGSLVDANLEKNLEYDNTASSNNLDSAQKIENDIQQEKSMGQSDDMLASIMEQNTSTTDVDSSVSVSMDEIAGVVSAMNDTNGAYTEDYAQAKKLEKNINILRNTVRFSYVQDFETPGEPLAEPNLYVIAERVVTDAAGNKSVSAGLKRCCEKMVKIHDFKRIIYIAELPLDNDEFVEFLRNVLNLQNVIVACEASGPSSLSDYCKQICEIAGVSLEKDDMTTQNKKAGMKTKTIMKMIVQDKF